MSQEIRALYLTTDPAIEKQVITILNAAKIDIIVEHVTSTQVVYERFSQCDCNLALLDGLPDKVTFDQRKDNFPIISIVDSSDEETAVAALEDGWIADYILDSNKSLKRLPMLFRAVLARMGGNGSQAKLDLERLRLLTKLKEDYDALVVVDQNGKVVYQTQDSNNLTGYSQEEIKNINPFELIHKSDAKKILPLFSELISSPDREETTRLRIRRKDGVWHWYEVSGTNMLEHPLVQGLLIRYSDIRKRRQEHVQQDAVYRIAQAALSATTLNDLFVSIHLIISEIMPASNFYIALCDAKQNTLEFPYYQDEFDDPPADPVKFGHGLTEYVIRSGKSLLCDQEVSDHLESKKEVKLVGSPSAIWLGVPLLIEKRVVGVMVVQDYEDGNAFAEREKRLLEFVSSQVASAIFRKQVDSELRENESRFRSMFENSTIGIYRSTPDGRLLMVNPALLRLSGYETQDELENIDLGQYGYVNPEDRKKFQALLERDGVVRGLESVWRKKDGSAMHVRESAWVIHNDADGEIYYEGVVEDITERKEAELALQEKVVALETLAEIDIEILLTKDAGTLLNMVCLRAVGLLKASKACIASIEGNSGVLLALHGFEDIDSVKDEFSQTLHLKYFNRRPSFLFRNLKEKNYKKFMPQTRKHENIRSAVAESFKAGSNFQAILIVLDEKPRNWNEDDQKLLKFLSGQVAISLEKTRLLNDAEQRAQNFQTLYSLVGEITSRREIEVVLNMIIKSVIQLFNTHCGFIYLFNETENNLKLTIIRGIDMELGFTLKMGEGLAGRVAKNKKPKRLDNYREWRYRARSLDEFHFSAIISVPMVYSDQLIGVLAVSEVGTPSRTFSSEEMRLLSLFAGQAASAVFNARLFSQIQQRNEELDRLYRSLGLLIAGITTDRLSLCQQIAEIVVSEFEHSNCCIWLLNENALYLERCGFAGLYADEIEFKPISRDGDSLIPTAIREGGVINISDVRESEEYYPGWDGAISELVVPLIVEQEVIGVIDLQNAEPFAFDEDDERLMSLFALRAALMLDHVRLIEQTEERIRRLRTLHVIETSVTSTLDLRSTLNTLVEQIQVRLNVDAVSILLLNQNLQMLEYEAGHGFLKSRSDQVRIRIGDDVSGRAALDQEIVYIPDLSRPGPVMQLSERISSENFVSAFAIPLIAKGQLFGVLEMFYRRLIQNDLEWGEYLETLGRQVAMAIDSISMFDQLQKTLMVQQAALDSTIESWALVLEKRGLEPEGHAQRMTVTTLELAQQMGIKDSNLADIYRGVLLHDIGKLLIPEAILLKPSALTEDEWELIHQHPTYALDLLSKIDSLKSALQIPYCHHEYWDASGYPRGLAGEQIPIEARIFQVVETWDLMSVDLPYRKASADEDVIAYIRSEAGFKFDPLVVERFLDMITNRM